MLAACGISAIGLRQAYFATYRIFSSIRSKSNKLWFRWQFWRIYCVHMSFWSSMLLHSKNKTNRPCPEYDRLKFRTIKELYIVAYLSPLVRKSYFKPCTLTKSHDALLWSHLAHEMLLFCPSNDGIRFIGIFMSHPSLKQLHNFHASKPRWKNRFSRSMFWAGICLYLSVRP